MKSISYIIPAFNCQDTLLASVESIIEGNMHSGDEIIIVDDASTDDTLSRAETLAENNPSIKIISHNINKGSAAASRNTGIDNAKNDLIFCLDSDNILVPNSVHILKEFMLSESASSAVFGKIKYFINDTKNVTSTATFKDGIISLSDALAGTMWPGPSGNYLFTKESWLNAKRYNESIGGAYDSWAFGIQQLATGTKMLTLKDSFYYHRHGYESTFKKENKKYNPSITALTVLLPYLNLLEDSSIEYIMSKKNRYDWFDNLEKRPLIMKGGVAGTDGKKVNDDYWYQRIHRKISKLIK